MVTAVAVATVVAVVAVVTVVVIASTAAAATGGGSGGGGGAVVMGVISACCAIGACIISGDDITLAKALFANLKTVGGDKESVGDGGGGGDAWQEGQWLGG
jgi:hypothetical protein